MNNEQQKNNTIENVLKKIQNNELDVKSKTYFRLKFAALIAVVLAICVVSLFFSSFIDFALHASGHTSLVNFGPTGWQLFLILFPWKLFVLEIALIILLEWVLRYFKFGYKVPVLYLLLGVIGLIAITGIIIDQTPLHSLLLSQADQHHLPQPFGDLYEDVRRPPPMGHGIFRGTITSVGSTTLVIDLDNPDGVGTTTSATVMIPKSQDVSSLQVGERVFIAGEMKQGEIEAHDIRDANDVRPFIDPNKKER